MISKIISGLMLGSISLTPISQQYQMQPIYNTDGTTNGCYISDNILNLESDNLILRYSTNICTIENMNGRIYCENKENKYANLWFTNKEFYEEIPDNDNADIYFTFYTKYDVVLSVSEWVEQDSYTEEGEVEDVNYNFKANTWCCYVLKNSTSYDYNDYDKDLQNYTRIYLSMAFQSNNNEPIDIKYASMTFNNTPYSEYGEMWVSNNKTLAESYQEGYKIGYNEGYENGCLDAAYEYREVGYEEGYDVGHQEGYELGQKDDFTKNGFKTLIFSILDYVPNSLKTLLNFNFMGINLLELFGFILSIVILYIIVKAIKK